MRVVLALFLGVLLNGCASKPMPAEMNETQVLENQTELSTGIAAADELLRLGENARLAGDYQTAAGHLERGLRLAPRSAALYLALAKTRLAMGDESRAQQMARKALSLLPAEPRGDAKRVQAEAKYVIERVSGY